MAARSRVDMAPPASTAVKRPDRADYTFRDDKLLEISRGNVRVGSAAGRERAQPAAMAG